MTRPVLKPSAESYRWFAQHMRETIESIKIPTTKSAESKTNKRKRPKEERSKPGSLPVVHVEIQLADCPTCGNVDHSMQRSIDQGDGSRLCYVRCRSCGQNFKKAVEFVRRSECD